MLLIIRAKYIFVTAEDNGGGSASDSGRSIASSVSTEPFFSVGQSEHDLPPAASRPIISSSNLPTEAASPNPISQLSDDIQVYSGSISHTYLSPDAHVFSFLIIQNIAVGTNQRFRVEYKC